MNCRLRRLLASLLVLAMFAGFVPSTMFTTVAKAAETGVEKSPIDQSTYEALGFVTDLGTTNESYVTGKSQGKTTMNVKNELFIDLQSHKNSGWIVRDNLNLNHTPTTDYGYMGAYRLYGHYMDSGKYDDLDSKYGWNYGHTVADPDNPYKDTINKNLETDGKHSNIVFETATEYRSSSGKLDRVAKLIVYSGRNRIDWEAYLEIFDATGGKMTRLYGRKLGNAPALDEAGTIYQQYFDALYDIAAGDFDGDGVDEIAVYYGTNTIKIFDTGIGNSISGLNSSDTVTISASSLLAKTTISGEFNADSSVKVRRAAIVSLEAGDLTKDFQDELAVAVSMPQGSTEAAHKNNASAY
ncbi:MAG: hypothetical protein IKU13_08000, partial [Clostridia bacterium]|nr:hypothetical protein [Clostridia bacterium]